MSDDFANEISHRSQTNWFRLLLIVIVAAGFFAWLLAVLKPQPRGPHPSLGKPAPTFVVDGWLNGKGPTIDELVGEFVVIDAFAYWCYPCLNAAPHTRELYEAYKDRSVAFIGLTSEGADKLDETREFLKEAEFPWPCAYGAAQSLARLYQSDYTPLPAMWVVNREGIIIWFGHPLDLTTEVLDGLMRDDASAKRR
jgi:thiol-disulfide isomerase/thioredoxin